MAPRKQASKPKTVPPDDTSYDTSWLDKYRDAYEGKGTTTTTTVPSTTTTSSGTSTTRTPATLSPDVKAAEQKLRYTAQQAQALGINTGDYYKPTTVRPTTQAGTTDTSWLDKYRDAYFGSGTQTAQPKKEKDGFWERLGKGALSVVGDAANIIGAPGRAIFSTIKEVSDIASGDASIGDWWDQLTDPTFGAGDVFGKTGNKWLDRAIGFTGDVLLDPLTYLTLGGSAVVKTGVTAAGRAAAKEVGDKLVKEGAEGLLKQGASQATVDALSKADDFYRVTQNGLKAAIDEGDEELIKLARQSLEEAGQGVTAASINVAKEIGGKNARVLLAEDARKVAYTAWANSADDAARIANEEALDKATQEVVRALGRKGARRTYRGAAREELAEQARIIRQQAENAILDIQRYPIQMLGPDSLRALKARAEQLRPLEILIDSLNDDVIKDIAVRGYNAIKDDAARALGVTNASRFAISLPGQRLGRRAVFLPGQGSLNKALGGAAVATRLALVNKFPGGERVLRAVTPLGRKGLFTEDEVLQWRTALRTGKVKADDAVRYTALLSANKDYINMANAARRKAGNQTRQALGSLNDEESEVVRKMLETDVNELMREGLPLSSREVRQIFRASGLNPSDNALKAWRSIRLALDAWYDEANSLARSLGANPLPRIKNYFPHSQSEKALKWIINNPDLADRVASGLGAGTNRQFLADNFVERSLKAGQKWFGYTLTDADIAGGAARLNEIARQYGNIDFDWFDMDIRRALARYADNHSRFMATYGAIDRLANKLGIPVDFAGTLAGDVVKEIPIKSYVTGKDEVLQSLEAIRNDIDEVLRSPDIRTLNEQEFDDWATAIEDKLDTVLAELYKGAEEPKLIGNTFVYPTIQSADIAEQINLIRNELINPEAIRDIASGYGDLLDDQIEQMRFRLLGPPRDETLPLEDLPEDITMLGAIDDVVENRLEYIQFVNRFPVVLEEGWTQLTTSVGPLRNLQVREELDNLFNNLKRVNDPQFARFLERTIGSFNRFFKSYATATPGFHVRNALSNAFQLVAAGVNIENVAPALKIWARYALANRRAIKDGLGGITPEDFVRGLGYPPSQEKLLIQALDSIDLDATAFTEVAGAPSGRVGITGGAITPGTRLERSRALLGTPVRVSRAAGQVVEGTNRFILTFDGLMRGLTPTEAIARTNKYLFDYSDLSRVDKSLRQIIPFWIWTSRNLPLQLENMLTNPRAYAQYFAMKKNLMDEDQPEYLPDYLKQGGAFTVDGLLVQPDLGIPGAGRPSQLEELSRIPLFFLAGEEDKAQAAVRNVLGSMSPLARLPIEYGTKTSLFTGRPIASTYSPQSEDAQINQYVASQLLPPLTNIGGIATITGISPEAEMAQRLLGITPPFTKNRTQEEIQRAEDEKRERRLFRYFGLPVRTLGEGEQTSEIYRRIRALEELILRERNARGL